MIVSNENSIVMANPAAQAMLGMEARIGSTFDANHNFPGKSITTAKAKAGGKNVSIVTIQES